MTRRLSLGNLSKLLFSLLLLACHGCSIAPKSPLDNFLAAPARNSPYRGVFHVHTEYSHDSGGSLREVIRAARQNRLDFAVVTDHNTLQGKRDYASGTFPELPLLIFGNEISTGDGHLIALAVDEEINPPVSGQDAIDQIHAKGGYAVLAHPLCDKSVWKDWAATGFDGMEIYNHACDFYDANKVGFALKSLLLSPKLFSREVVREPRKTIRKWDELLAARPVAGFGAIDAHVKFSFLGLALIRYTNLFRSATLYVFADHLTEKDIISALVSGNSFIAFESLGDAGAFSFEARTSAERLPMGREVRSETPVTLVVTAPKSAVVRLIQNGLPVKEMHGEQLTFDVSSAGIYRVEVFRHGKLWIVSNAITVQA